MAGSEYIAPVLSYGALDRAHLTKHLLELARAVGVEKVTMRGLAAHAGTSASSVYYHVKDKSEMLDLLVDAVVGSIEVPETGNWEQRLVRLYTNAWRVLSAVPGIATLLQQRPRTQAVQELDSETQKVFRESGLMPKDFAAAHAVLYIHLLGSVELEHRRQAGAGPPADDGESVFLFGLKVILAGLKQI